MGWQHLTGHRRAYGRPERDYNVPLDIASLSRDSGNCKHRCIVLVIMDLPFVENAESEFLSIISMFYYYDCLASRCNLFSSNVLTGSFICFLI